MKLAIVEGRQKKKAVRERKSSVELEETYPSALGALSALRNTRGFWRFARKFYQEVNGSKEKIILAKNKIRFDL